MPLDGQLWAAAWDGRDAEATSLPSRGFAAMFIGRACLPRKEAVNIHCVRQSGSLKWKCNAPLGGNGRALVSLRLRLKDLLGPVTRVKKKREAETELGRTRVCSTLKPKPGP